MIEPDWITKTQAAELLGCDERTIERRARAGRIQTRARAGWPTLYWLADVEKLRQTAPGDVHTGILETVPPASSNGHGTAIATTRNLDTVNPADDPIRQLAALVVAALAQGPTGPTGPTRAATGPTFPKIFLTLKEASALSGLPQADVRRLCREGELPYRLTGRGGIRIRRKDLEAL